MAGLARLWRLVVVVMRLGDRFRGGVARLGTRRGGGHLTHGSHTFVLPLATAEEVGSLAAEILINRMVARPISVLLPTGHTPLPFYRALRDQAERGRVLGSRAAVFQLDEYCGLAPADPRTSGHYLERALSGSGLTLGERFSPGGADPHAETARYDRVLDETAVDLAILGIGRNGHVAFNEPGSDLVSGARVVALSESTRQAAASEFGDIQRVPTRAMTVGLRTLLEARELLVLVTGSVKADILRAALTGPPRADVPASLLRLHPRLTVLCDLAAAARIRVPHVQSDRVVIVLGHRDPDSRRHRASRQSFGRLAVAAELAGRTPVRATVLTGYTSAGGLSEAEQMAEEWNVAGVPALLEVAGRDTTGNATHSLPLVLAIGGIKHVTVVTSAWHIRARKAFAGYRRAGLEVTMRYDWRHGPWVRMLRNEIRLIRLGRSSRRRRAAQAE